MKEFYLPIEERMENLDLACNIATSEALGEDGPVFTLFQGVPMVALPVDGPDMVRDNWQRLFEQFQATPETTEQCAPEPPEKRGIKAWIEQHPFLATAVLGLVAGSLAGFGCVDAGIDAIQGIFHPSHVVTYDKRDASISIDIDAWKRGMGCAEHDYLQMESQAVGSAHGNRLVKLIPYCVGPSSLTLDVPSVEPSLSN